MEAAEVDGAIGIVVEFDPVVEVPVLVGLGGVVRGQELIDHYVAVQRAGVINGVDKDVVLGAAGFVGHRAGVVGGHRGYVIATVNGPGEGGNGTAVLTIVGRTVVVATVVEHLHPGEGTGQPGAVIKPDFGYADGVTDLCHYVNRFGGRWALERRAAYAVADRRDDGVGAVLNLGSIQQNVAAGGNVGAQLTDSGVPLGVGVKFLRVGQYEFFEEVGVGVDPGVGELGGEVVLENHPDVRQVPLANSGHGQHPVDERKIFVVLAVERAPGDGPVAEHAVAIVLHRDDPAGLSLVVNEVVAASLIDVAVVIGPNVLLRQEPAGLVDVQHRGEGFLQRSEGFVVEHVGGRDQAGPGVFLFGAAQDVILRVVGTVRTVVVQRGRTGSEVAAAPAARTAATTSRPTAAAGSAPSATTRRPPDCAVVAQVPLAEVVGVELLDVLVGSPVLAINGQVGVARLQAHVVVMAHVVVEHLAHGGVVLPAAVEVEGIVAVYVLPVDDRVQGNVEGFLLAGVAAVRGLAFETYPDAVVPLPVDEAGGQQVNAGVVVVLQDIPPVGFGELEGYGMKLGGVIEAARVVAAGGKQPAVRGSGPGFR